jgi:hypothetical protein
MPITAFQKQVLALLKANRNPESYVAGGTAIQRAHDSIRYSEDVDIFHDVDQAVTDSYNADKVLLEKCGYIVATQISQPSFYRAVVGKEGNRLKLEWVRDTAFRYFPVVDDDALGYRLHDVDLAVNKCLALANRSVVRDALDIVELDRDVMSLAAMISAACGKDPGFTPELMLEMIQRHMTFTPVELAAESLTKPVDAQELKRKLLKLLDETRRVFQGIAPQYIGCIFVDKKGQILKDLSKAPTGNFTAHHGSVKGSWPLVIDFD